MFNTPEVSKKLLLEFDPSQQEVEDEIVQANLQAHQDTIKMADPDESLNCTEKLLNEVIYRQSEFKMSIEERYSNSYWNRCSNDTATKQKYVILKKKKSIAHF